MSLIKVVDVTKTFGEGDSATHALRGVSFDIKIGEFVAIMGPSGSGKSTLLHVLGFLDSNTSGTYQFDGKTMEDYTDDELAHIRNKKMGFIFQQFNLLPRTSVLENVKLPLLYSGTKESLWDTKALAAIKMVGLEHRTEHESSELSGGEKQRVAIARALVNNPNLIFADEPTGNLDSLSGGAVMETLQELNINEGHTVILITHETYTAEYANRIIKLKDGVIESDAPVLNRRKSTDKFIK